MMLSKKISYPCVVVFSLCPIVAASTRLGYGIYLSVGVLWLFFSCLLARFLVKKIQLPNITNLVEIFFVVASVILFENLANFVVPVLVSCLSIFLYLETFVAILLMNILQREYEVSKGDSLVELFLAYFLVPLKFIVFILAFSFVRELLGFGSISVPNSTGLYVIQIFGGEVNSSVSLFRYVISTGGGLVLSGLVICLLRFFTAKGVSLEGEV